MDSMRLREHPVIHTIYSRRAVRSYTRDPVEAATVRALLEVATQAPTAMHQEPWAFLVVRQRTTLKWLSDVSKAQVLQEAHAHAPLLRTPGGSNREERSPLSFLEAPDFDIFYDAGTLVVICGRGENPFVTADCWLAAENLMLAATAHGLGTCVIGLAVGALSTTDVKATLGIPPGVTPVAPIIVGHPSGPTPPSTRKPPEILRWID